MASNLMSSAYSFLLLPFEVRQIIYSHLFANATTTIHDVAPCYYLLLYTEEEIRNSKGLDSFDQSAYLPVSRCCHNAILYTNKQVYAEAWLALMQSLHLRFSVYPLEAVHIPPAIRAHTARIKHVTMGQRGNRVPDIDMSLFPGLELLEIDVTMGKSSYIDRHCDSPNRLDYCGYGLYSSESSNYGYEVAFLDRENGIQAASLFLTTPGARYLANGRIFESH